MVLATLLSSLVTGPSQTRFVAKHLAAAGVRGLVAKTEPFFSFHHVNAFEAPDGKVVIDTCAMNGVQALLKV